MKTLFSFRNLSIVSFISSIIVVLLMLVRIWCAFSFSVPLQLTTSGWEEESLYTMWKYIKGMKIYTDRHSIPYTASVYNWLFYQSYGFVIKNFIFLFSLSISWIPTVGRFFTLVGALIGVFICYASFVNLLKIKDLVLKSVAFSFALLVFFGPLVGFWAFTVRPDVWSLVFEVTGVFLFWRYYSLDKTKAIFFSALVLYCSWAFKQSGFLTVVAILVFLIVKKDFKALLIFSILMIALYVTTFLLGSKEYTDTILYHSERGFSFNLAIKNILKAALKSSPAIFTLISSIVFIIFCKRLKKEILKKDNILFSIILLFTTIIIVFPASAMEGAADNYCFMVLYSSSLIAITLLNEISHYKLNENDKDRLIICIGFMIFGWITNIISIMTVFIGYQGVISVYPTHIDMIKKQKCIEKLPKPLFVDNMYLSLPWINPSEPYVFTNWFYKKERESGVLKDGGIGGLIKKGHYKILLLSDKMKTFDGADLSEYKILPNKCEGFCVYVRD